MNANILRISLVAMGFMTGACTEPTELTNEPQGEYETWQVANGSKANTKYSSLDQVNRQNVHRLKVVWEYHTDDQGYTIECNPIIIGKTLYGTSASVNAFALDATTGKERWTFDPYAYEGSADRLTGSWAVNRGVTYWQEGEEETIFFGAGPFLYALDPATGKPKKPFGEKGRVDLLKGLDRQIADGQIALTSPALVYNDLVIVGGRVSEGAGKVVPGHVRAYDVRTGARRWIFHTIPHPGEHGYDTWPKDAWKTFGGANAWGGFSLDEERGLIFFGTGSPSHDHFGHHRRGKNLFGNSVVALKAQTGERVWHYQLVHHDLWDYDLPTPPNLATIVRDEQSIDVAAQVTKMGFLFVFNRETGAPVFPVEERPVRQSEVPGESSWPTQPFPTQPRAYARQGFKEEEITTRTPEAHAFVREHVFDRYGEASLYDPPSFKGDVVHPQFNGGTDWGGAAVDIKTGILYVNTSNEPELTQVLKVDEKNRFPYTVTGHQPVKDNEGYPINTPPWGTLTAIDLNRGLVIWQVPFGNYPGMEGEYPSPTGTFNMGGPVVTAGGLVFLGASMDEMFRAFDKETGEVLWETRLPAGGYATPAVYAIDGRQYIVIAAGGGGKPGTRPGDAFVAFSLSDSEEQPLAAGQPETEPPATARGEQIYTSRCSSCHQYNGLGVGQEFPPLTNTEWVTGDKGRLISVVLGGLHGEIQVNNRKYAGAMPPWGAFLDDEQVAALLTYIRSSWGNDAGPVTPEEVAAVRESTQDREQMWTEEELNRESNSFR